MNVQSNQILVALSVLLCNDAFACYGFSGPGEISKAHLKPLEGLDSKPFHEKLSQEAHTQHALREDSRIASFPGKLVIYKCIGFLSKAASPYSTSMLLVIFPFTSGSISCPSCISSNVVEIDLRSFQFLMIRLTITLEGNSLIFSDAPI